MLSLLSELTSHWSEDLEISTIELKTIKKLQILNFSKTIRRKERASKREKSNQDLEKNKNTSLSYLHYVL